MTRALTGPAPFLTGRMGTSFVWQCLSWLPAGHLRSQGVTGKPGMRHSADRRDVGIYISLSVIQGERADGPQTL